MQATKVISGKLASMHPPPPQQYCYTYGDVYVYLCQWWWCVLRVLSQYWHIQYVLPVCISYSMKVTLFLLTIDAFSDESESGDNE